MLLLTALLFQNSLSQPNLHCRDVNGYEVNFLANQNINDIAVACLFNGNPVVFYKTDIFFSFKISDATRLFFYAHECMHHSLGHVLITTADPISRLPIFQLYMEKKADSAAIKTLWDMRLIDSASLQQITIELSKLAPGDFNHLPGPERAFDLFSYLNFGKESPIEDTDISCQDGCREECRVCEEEAEMTFQSCFQEKQSNCLEKCFERGYDLRYGRSCHNLCSENSQVNKRSWESSCREEIREYKKECRSTRNDCLDGCAK